MYATVPRVVPVLLKCAWPGIVGSTDAPAADAGSSFASPKSSSFA
jgi:hypothetical protein